MRRPMSILLLEAFLVIEGMFLLPVVAFAPIALVASLAGGRIPHILSLPILLGALALAALNVACWRRRAWALWIRAGLCFFAATALASVVPRFPVVAVLVTERALQTGLAVWLAARA